MDDLSKMISYSSCAELETILNEAAILAASKRKDSIEMDDLVSSVLRKQYNTADQNGIVINEEENKRTALHEAGHLVCSEVLCPGSVGFVSIRPNQHEGLGGFVHRCKDLLRRPYDILTCLASKAAVELYYADHVAGGCYKDIERAFTLIRDGMATSTTFGFGMVDVATRRFSETSESLNSRHESVAQALLEQYYLQEKDILIKNREFLECVANELTRKSILLHSEIQKSRRKSLLHR